MTTSPGPTSPDRDRGSATLELVVLAPALLALLGIAVVAGRFESAAAAVEQASASAARAASLARTAADARNAATRAATDVLDQRDLHCTGLDVDVRLTAAARAASGVRSAGNATVTVSCTLDLSTVSLPGVPGSRQIVGRTVSVLDAYRSAP